ncbi:polysaccharide deacetylase family protein [Flavobacterium sp. GT3R68]|uniref:polysaccharide deacetylase family protein n=1 Tax=Flavobacterium sp. GT3R68 TaxID=2594437 RepID=UPI000F88A839|nr:polysaccharide deacetylase family protein [Flavobacterium sp. GT3R68]RTY93932.1 polysaccharide deacetylase family protein [Flavobacterium sp. GSN2]TRW93454.1 polysaccharide deacetylase family protein [Flavobacterium sp. GT3R68]
MLKHKNITFLCASLLALLSVFSFFSEVNWWLFLVVVLLWLGFIAWGSFDIRLGYFVKTYCNNPLEKQKKVALTFDDGPHPMTEKILDLLQQSGVKATFFCIGSQIEKYPEIFRRIIREGHLVGNHSYSHTTSFGFLSADEVEDEISKTNAIIEKISGKKVLFFRPPFGVTTPNLSRAVHGQKSKIIGWNIRSLDTVTEDENQILSRIKKKLVPGGIILMHDTSQKSVNVLERLLLFLQLENYGVISTEQLLKTPAYED